MRKNESASELRIDQQLAAGWERMREPLILACTNGRHD